MLFPNLSHMKIGFVCKKKRFLKKVLILSIFQVCYYLCASSIVDLFRWTSSVVKRWNGYLRSSKSMHSSRENPRNSSYLATWLYLGGWPACTPPTWWTRTRLWRRTTTTKKTHQNRVIHLDNELEKKIAVQKVNLQKFREINVVIQLQI